MCPHCRHIKIPTEKSSTTSGFRHHINFRKNWLIGLDRRRWRYSKRPKNSQFLLYFFLRLWITQILTNEDKKNPLLYSSRISYNIAFFFLLRNRKLSPYTHKHTHKRAKAKYLQNKVVYKPV